MHSPGALSSGAAQTALGHTLQTPVRSWGKNPEGRWVMDGATDIGGKESEISGIRDGWRTNSDKLQML